MANEQISDALVRKIQLLLNLGQRSEGNEAEAAAAMAKAQELLAQYNLDLATVQDKVVAGGTAAREAETKRDYAVSKRSAMYKWQQNLVRAIAEANFCVYWMREVQEELYIPPSKRRWASDEAMQKRWVKRHQVLGRLVNTTSVMIMVDYLLETIERLVPYPQQERLSRDANIWREGCSDRLVERIQAKAEAMRKADFATQGEQAYCTAIQVADLARKEEAANYDHQHGAGAWAKKLQRDAEWDAKWAAEAAERAERSRQLEAERVALIKAETPAQRKARERKEAAQRRRNERYWDAQDRAQERREARRYTAAYAEGRRSGDNIGLDTQVGTTTTKELK